MARILIVDDTEIVRAAITRAVRELGHVAVTLPDVVEALALAQKHPPDLALLDFQMPLVDGATFSVLRPLPPQSPHLSRTIFPSPRQAGQVVWTRKKPCDCTTWPCPLQ